MNICILIIILLLILLIYLVVKIICLKSDINNINGLLDKILNTDTNNLIVLKSNDKTIRKFATNLNKHLKILRKKELELDLNAREIKNQITNISHDLRTPLTVIKCYLEDLKLERLKDDSKKKLSIILNKESELEYLIQNLFTYSSKKLEGSINEEKVNLNTLLEDRILSFYDLFKKRNIIPKLEICDEVVIRDLDKKMIERIFDNIIINVLNHGEDEFKVVLKENGEILFSNKAYGLDNVQLEKIFNRFYTVENAKTSNGVGLAIVKELTEESGGKIKAIYKNNILKIIIKF